MKAEQMKRRRNVCVIEVEGTLRVPMKCRLSETIAALVRRGERRLLMDLAELQAIDAAGIGELIRAYTMTGAAGGGLRVAHPTRRVHHLLLISGVLDVLTEQNPSSTPDESPCHGCVLGAM
jgi:anti-sigma B factor antagonist